MIADSHRSHEDRIAADENAFANVGGIFLEAVVVASDRACTDVGFGTDLGVAEISKVGDLRASADNGFRDSPSIAAAKRPSSNDCSSKRRV